MAPNVIRVAVVQAAPVLFDRARTLDKALQLTADAAARGAELVLFPEAFIPAYPRGLTFGAVVGHRDPEGRVLWQRYWENAVEVPGPETEALGRAAATHGIHLRDRISASQAEAHWHRARHLG